MRKNRGVTLVSLIITIIILLILAGITIGQLTGNGIFDNAKVAKEKYENAAEEENSILSLVDIQGEISNGTRDDTNTNVNAMMLSINITDVTTSSFKINVNSVEADNHNTLYYYVNDTMVYSGKEKSFVVTSINGNPIKDNQRYEICVLSEPFKISIYTLEGDNVDSWLACIGNPNNEKYSIENLEELFQNETIMNNLLNSKEASEYLAKSTEKIFPALMNSQEGMKKLAKSEWAAYMIINDGTLRNKLNNSSCKSYFEEALNKIPVQSSNTNAFAISINKECYPYKVFDNNTATYWWAASNGVPGYVGYNFNKKVIPYKVELVNYNNNGYRCKNFYIQGSIKSNNSGYSNLTSQGTLSQDKNWHTFYINNFTPSQYVRVYITSHYKDKQEDWSVGISDFQVYYINVPAELQD